MGTWEELLSTAAAGDVIELNGQYAVVTVKHSAPKHGQYSAVVKAAAELPECDDKASAAKCGMPACLIAGRPHKIVERPTPTGISIDVQPVGAPADASD